MIPIRVLVAIGDPSLRERVCEDLASSRALEVVASVADTRGLRPRIGRRREQVTVVDGELAAREPPLVDALAGPVVAVINGADDRGVARLVEAGVRGFVRCGAPDLEAAVCRVAAGGIAVDPELATRLLPVLVRVNARRLEATAALELARESLTVQVQELVETNTALELARESLDEQLSELLVTYRETVRALAGAVELRDEYTGGHIERVAAYARAVAGALDPVLTGEPAVLGYMLHDIGKLALPDAVLFNTGPLSADQFEVVKRHTVEGARLVEGIPFLRPALQIVRNHHERWDGAGYPDGLAGTEIPKVVRVFTLADALDAITTDRPYQGARSLDFALDEFDAKAGSQFDPDVVAVFRSIVETDPAFSSLRDGIAPGSASGR